MIEIEPNAFYTVQELERISGISAKSLRLFIRQGRLRGHKIATAWRIRGRDFEALLEGTGESDDDDRTSKKH